MATKKKDNNGPSTQRTGTVGVSAIGVNHGMTRQEAVKPTPQQAMAQMSQTVVPAAQPQQVPAQQTAQVTAPQTQVVQTQPAATVQTATTPVQTNVQTAQPVQQSQLPSQITLPGGQVINLQQPTQTNTVPVKIGNTTYQVEKPIEQPQTNTNQQQPTPKSAAQQNAEYEQAKVQQQVVDAALDAGISPNLIRENNDPALKSMQPTAEQVQKANEYNQAQAQKKAEEGDAIQKTLMERLDELNETPEKKAEREKREARQRRWAAISEGIANVFNVGGAVAGARPAQWKSAVGDLYTNQEAESDKRKAEYKEALRDLITYRNAVRNGDIATQRAIEEKRKNDIYEYRIMQDLEGKAAERQLRADKQAADEKRKDQQQSDRHEEHTAKMEGRWSPSGTSKGSSSGGGRSGGRRRSGGGSRATGAAAAKSAKAAAKRRAKAATQGTKFGKK